MVRFGVALSVFVSASTVHSFHVPRPIGTGNQLIQTRQNKVNARHNVSSYSNADYGEASFSDALSSVTNAARDQLVNEFSDVPDAEEEEISERMRMVERRRQT